ncbi:MAG: MATE family efflux transporter [Dehalococcoidales bacterium]|nr:MATE family efflux transporter [Dehalococcoidales bacterium]
MMGFNIRKSVRKYFFRASEDKPYADGKPRPDGAAKLSAQAESRKFTGDVIWFAIAQLFVSIVLGVVTLPALTKSYEPLVYGIWIQMNVTVDFISPLLSLQLGLSAVRFLAGEENTEKRRRALGAMLSATTLIVLFASAAGIVFSRQLSSFLFNSPEYTTYIDFLVLWVAFNSVFNFLQSYLRARSRIKEISIIQIILTVLKVVAILVLATRAATIGNIFAAMVTLQVLFTVITLAIIIRETGFPFPRLRGLGTY